jgi:hypothetical protein
MGDEKPILKMTKTKIIKQTAFCGKQNRVYTACLNTQISTFFNGCLHRQTGVLNLLYFIIDPFCPYGTEVFLLNTEE